MYFWSSAVRRRATSEGERGGLDRPPGSGGPWCFVALRE
jgi:hypothetical protein